MGQKRAAAAEKGRASLTPLPRPLRLGVIGLGGIAQSSHLPALAILRLRGWPVSVVAVADPAPERIASALRLLAPSQAVDSASCRTYSNGAELLAVHDAVDAVLLLTPPAYTAPLLENALQRGIPALAEKPTATDSPTLARLVEAEKAAADPLVRIAYNRHSLPLVPAFLTQIREMRERASNHVVHVEARLWRTHRDTPIFYDDTMVHALDFLNWCAGPLFVERVEWWPAANIHGLRTGLRVALRSEKGGMLPPLTAHLDVRPAVGRDVESYEVLGNRKAVTLLYPSPDDKTAQAGLTRYENRQSFPIPADAEANEAAADPDGLSARGFLPQLAHFLQFAAGDTNAGAALCTLAQAHETMLLKEKILSSLEDH